MSSREAMVVHEDGPDAGALAAVSREAGVMALAMMGVDEFEARLAALKLGRDRVRRIQQELMVGPSQENPAGEDYGVIPGTNKPTLLKPGAEKICNVYGLVPVFEETWIEGDGVTSPHLRVRIKCRLHRGHAEGPVAGEGAGAANSFEKKHRYRGAKRACPSCGCEGTIKRSSFEKDGDKGWYCHGKAGGCGANFHSADPTITEQQGGQVDNPDPWDVENTLLKMASKRAQVDATLRVTATSGLFTQDLEDQAGGDDSGGGDRGSAATGGSSAPASTGQPRQAARPTPAPARAATPSQAQRSTGGLPRWTAACPRCDKTGTVIVSKMKVGFYHCWKKNGGCDYDFTPEDAQVHSGAAAERAVYDTREPGAEG